MTGADPELRQAVLRYASGLASDPSDPIAVVLNAVPLLAFLQDADDAADQAVRRACMDRQYGNLFFEAVPVDPVTPEEFLADVLVLYAFVTAVYDGDQAPEAA